MNKKEKGQEELQEKPALGKTEGDPKAQKTAIAGRTPRKKKLSRFGGR